MITPIPKRILSQDFPDEVRSWIQTLLIPINQFMTSVSQLLNHGLTFQNHFNAEIKTIQVRQGDTPVLSCNLKSKPIGILVLAVHEELKNQVGIDWLMVESGIKIRNIFGLEQGKFYSIKLLILGG